MKVLSNVFPLVLSILVFLLLNFTDKAGATELSCNTDAPIGQCESSEQLINGSCHPLEAQNNAIAAPVRKCSSWDLFVLGRCRQVSTTNGKILKGLPESEIVRSESCPSVFSCANCTAVRICKPHLSGHGFTAYKDSNCTGSTPYCDPDTGTCAQFPTAECARKDEYVCVRDGVFPDPTNCKKFYNCTNLVAHSLTCLFGYNYNYDSDSESCKTDTGCYEIGCSDYNGYKIPYEKDPSIYAYCTEDRKIVMDRCNGNDELNVVTQTCEPTCHCPGLLADTSDCTRYYKCRPIQPKGKFIMSLHNCPKGYGYDQDNVGCVPLAHIPWCSGKC